MLFIENGYNTISIFRSKNALEVGIFTYLIILFFRTLRPSFHN